MVLIKHDAFRGRKATALWAGASGGRHDLPFAFLPVSSPPRPLEEKRQQKPHTHKPSGRRKRDVKQKLQGTYFWDQGDWPWTMGPLISEINNNNCLSLFVRDFEREQRPPSRAQLSSHMKRGSLSVAWSLCQEVETPPKINGVERKIGRYLPNSGLSKTPAFL